MQRGRQAPLLPTPYSPQQQAASSCAPLLLHCSSRRFGKWGLWLPASPVAAPLQRSNIVGSGSGRRGSGGCGGCD